MEVLHFLFHSDLVVKTQNPLIYDPRFKEFSIPSSGDFVGGDGDELLLCPIRALRKYLSCTEQYRAEVSNSFVSTKREKRVSQNTISFWIRSVISHVYRSASDEDCRLVKVKAHKDRKMLLHCCYGGSVQSNKY